MSEPNEWLVLTPAGALRAFALREPDAAALALQGLLVEERSLATDVWLTRHALQAQHLADWAAQGWVQRLNRPLQGPDARLDDFLQHVIGSLSAERRAVLASDGGFCLGRCGVDADEADLASAAAADFGAWAQRQAKRGWSAAQTAVSFHPDADFLLPSWSFTPFWVDGAGYWLIVGAEPLLNNPALVELMWGLKMAGTRFAHAAG